MTSSDAVAQQPNASQVAVSQGVEPQRFGVGLYLLTLVLELPGMLARWALLSFLFWVIAGINRAIAAISLIFFNLGQLSQLGQGSQGQSAPPQAALGGTLLFLSDIGTYIASVDEIIIFLVTLAPVLFSIATFFLPGGFFLRRFALGAREPSYRERQSVNAVIDELDAAVQGKLKLPRTFYVIDKLSREAHVIGTTLYLTRGALTSPYLAALIAHNLGHIKSIDGRLILALRRLVLFPVYLLSRSFGQLAPGAVSLGASAGSGAGCVVGAFVWLFGLLLSLAGGGFGLWALNLPWSWFWRQREYAADAYAITLGQQGNLSRYLEELSSGGAREASFDVATPFLVLAPPAPELRLDRVTYPENYLDTDRLNLRPFYLAALLCFALFCGFPYVVRQATQAAFRVEGTNWRLVNFCLSSGCEPNQSSSAADFLQDQEVMLWFTQAGQSGGVGSSTVAGNTYYGGMSGTYTYIEPNRILINVESNEGAGSQITMGGSWRIEKEGDRLRLVGDYATYDFVPMEKFPTSVPTAPRGTSLEESVIGLWQGVSQSIARQTMELTAEGRVQIRANTGEVFYEGTYQIVDGRLVSEGLGPLEIIVSDDGNTLVLNPNTNNQTTYQRVR
jgi:Zn-dependent protease with chaperone function